MNASAEIATPPTKTKRWVYPVGVAAVAFVGFMLAGPFMVATGPRSHFQLPGVGIFVLTSFICSFLFLRAPLRPWWCKVGSFVFLLPALFFAIYSVMLYLAFGVDP